MTAIARHIHRLQGDGGLKETDIANFADVSWATVRCWKSGSQVPKPDVQLLLGRLHCAASRLRESYTADEVRAWLYSTHPQLEGQRAIDLIVEDRTAEVIAILDRLDAEAYL